VGFVFHGTEGTLVGGATYANVFDLKGNPVTSFTGEGNHFRNFIDAVKSRKREDLTADVLEGHRSTTLVHLANTSYRLGRQEPLSCKEPFGGYLEGDESFQRLREHLRENEIDFEKSSVRVGRFLEFDGSSESFVGDAEANKLLRRDYRKPFVVPDTV